MSLLKQALRTGTYEQPPSYSSTMTSLPTRSNTTATSTTMGGSSVSSGDGPQGDPSTSIGLLQERLQAWKHTCGYLEEYIKEVAKVQKTSAKDQDKILKSLSHPLREGHHFDSALGGISGLFENLRANTQSQSNLYVETEKNLHGQVLPILERLHAEIKSKTKELESGAGKGAKAVDAARKVSQKYIDALAQSSARFDSSHGRLAADDDPYVLQRNVNHHLNKQVLEENNNRQDVIAVQNSFQQFEAHVVTTLQTALNSFNQFMSGQADRQKAMFGDIASTASNIPLDFEWNGFRERSSNVLVNPNAPPRSMDNISFPNQGHRATKPLIEGSLERKSRGGVGALTGYKSGYYAITPAGWLHQFKDNDDFHKEPSPEKSIYLPDSTIGAVDGQKFTIKGKDSSGNKLSQKMSISSEFQFKAHTGADAVKWHEIIADMSAGQSTSLPTSPVESRNITPIATHTEAPASTVPPAQESGVVTSPTESGKAAQAAHGSPIATQASPAQAAPAQGLAAPNQNTGLARSSSGAGDGKHYHSGPATNELGEREYVAKQ
ncbi:uncharacterized protein HMPREF1541_05781 [Cyphellophora europaea CBS 101466]|uniref:PH domain-containing protein n=1 Tax=Cyphellophora europaea (strain CBS 101466) TaxID=1220924 RepID=W2RTB1_CYPE1|nr:uncharacterized protein HMPREF1541_05781 [Cyphellophora europaea CBS 101466]ETN39555.1 hypothetical protein HMPREF1541_05781 [Cyphellophora europaea CBS 101466]